MGREPHQFSLMSYVGFICDIRTEPSEALFSSSLLLNTVEVYMKISVFSELICDLKSLFIRHI